MANYGAISCNPPSSTKYRDLPPSQTHVSRSISPCQSQDGPVEDSSHTERNGQGTGARNVRFASPQGRGRGSSSILGVKGASNDASADDSDSVADFPESSTRAGADQDQRLNGADDHEGEGSYEAHLPWPTKLRERMTPSLVLENSGSVARDHLASERTFLAYVRTSLAIASSGVALVQLFSISITSKSGAKLNSHLQKFARPLGALAVCMGILLLLIGSTRYFRVQKALISGKFPPARKTIIFVSSVLTVLVAVLFGTLIAVPRR